MSRNLVSSSGLLLLVAVFFVFNMLNNLIFSSARIDLTENKLYTVTDGSREIIAAIDEPLNLYFFFSDKASEDLTALRTYAKRVEELLNEYALHSDGKINLSVIDPVAFSEAEDQAGEFGLQSVPINNVGEELYFGLAGTNSLDNVEIISFFQPDKEEFLEYEISKLIYNLTTPSKPVIGLMTSLKMQGDMDMRTFQSVPAWIISQQIEQLFDVKSIESSVDVIPDDVDLLMVVHPKNPGEVTEKAIDQFVMGGGKLMLFVDPMAESDQQNANPMMPAPASSMASDLNRLTEAWGVRLQSEIVLGDAKTALMVGSPSGGRVRHLAIQSMSTENFRSDEIITSSLESINIATAGILETVEGSTTRVEPVLLSSEVAEPLQTLQFQFLADPADLQKGFTPTGQRYMVAARISGPAKSAFSDDVPSDWIAQADDIAVLVFADTDLLTDRLWVQVQDFFGQQIASPFANNSDLVINSLDNLAGSPALISIRSRGRFTRPFDVVQNLRREAEARNLQQANELQLRLTETEQKLTELQSNREEQGTLTLSPEQESALVNFQNEKLKIRKELREVRHQLDNDIETLGSWLKFINIALVPLLLTVMLLAFQYLRLAKAKHN